MNCSWSWIQKTETIDNITAIRPNQLKLVLALTFLVFKAQTGVSDGLKVTGSGYGPQSNIHVLTCLAGTKESRYFEYKS